MGDQVLEPEPLHNNLPPQFLQGLFGHDIVERLEYRHTLVFGLKRKREERHEHAFGAQEQFPVARVGFLEPERMERFERIKDAFVHDAAGRDLVRNPARLLRAEVDDGDGGEDDKDAEEEVAPDERSNGPRERNDAECPEPVRLHLAVLEFICFPSKYSVAFLHGSILAEKRAR